MLGFIATKPPERFERKDILEIPREMNIGPDIPNVFFRVELNGCRELHNRSFAAALCNRQHFPNTTANM